MSWRLLATLEAGVMLLVAALLLYVTRSRRTRRRVRSVMISNTKNCVGRILKEKLEEHCTVHTYTGAAVSQKVDALIIVGADADSGLDGVARLITEDVNGNINMLESLYHHVRPGGCIVWTCAGATSGSFKDASHAFDAVLRASLQHVCKRAHCEPIWVGRHIDAEAATESVLQALVPCTTDSSYGCYTLRVLSESISNYLDRFWKMVTLQASCPPPVT